MPSFHARVDAQLAALPKVCRAHRWGASVYEWDIGHLIPAQVPANVTQNFDDYSGAVFCEPCEMWLNGPTQWEDHKISRKHKKNCWRNCGDKSPAGQLVVTIGPPDTAESKVEIPAGTARIIEQTGVRNDARMHWQPKHKL